MVNSPEPTDIDQEKMTNQTEARRKHSSLRSFSSDLGPVEEETMADGELFSSPRDDQGSPVQNLSSPGSGSTFETIQRTPSLREIIKAKIKYHNMNPVQKYRARRRKPWKLILQIVKIVLITVQVCLFGLDRFSLVLFLENNSIALKHLFLKDYRNNKPVVVYEKQELYDHLHYAHEQYYQVQTVPLGNYDFTKTVNGSSAPQVQLCYSYYVGAHIDPANKTSVYKFSFKVKRDCKYLPYPSNSTHIVKNNTFDFERVLQVQLLFSLKTVNLKNVKAWDKPACYQLNVEILFDNTQHDGKIPVTLNMSNTWLGCKGEIKGLDSIKTHFITVALVIFDALVTFLCFISLVLCLRSIYRSLLLAKECADFFKRELAVNFTWSDYREFVSLWFFVIMISDCLTIIGSVYKMAIDQKDSDFYDVCSLFLGCAVLLVWFGLLRFLGYFRKYNVLLVTLRAAAPSVARFCVCVSVFFVGFMFCGWIVLGPFHPKFKTLTVTAECLFSMVNGDDLFHSYSLLAANTPILVWVFSKVYLYVFIALFIYVVLSLFIGILGDTYERLKDMGHLPQTKIQKFLREPANAGRGQRSQASGRSPGVIQTPHPQARHRNSERILSGGTYTDAIMNIVSIDSTGAE